MTRISLFRVNSELESLPCKIHSCWIMKQISNKFHQQVLTIIMFFSCFCRHGIKTWKSWPNFFKFQFMSILTIRCNRPQEKEKSSITKLGHYSEAPNVNFRKNVCLEDDLRSRIFRTFDVKFLACLPLLGFSNV